MKNKVSIKVGGPAGGGVFTIGLLLSKYFKKLGLEVVYTTDYPSLIKGGHNTCSVRAEDAQIYSEKKMHDILIALDDLTIDKDLKELVSGGVLICSESSKFSSKKYRVLKLPLNALLEGLDKRVSNTIYFGAALGTIGIDMSILKVALESHFKKKGKEVIDSNFLAAKKGCEFSVKSIVKSEIEMVRVKEKTKRIFINGNDAAAIGAIKAGVKFIGEYPMTPSTSFLHYMAALEKEFSIVTKQTEDEIAAINSVIGASVVGVRAMSATSGGGFALMNEAIGFAGIAENPLVVFECMRAGPSTGIPTYTDQGDLKFVINSSQGEFPMVVLAPGDSTEAFYESFNAFNIAEELQVPVIVLLDKHLAATYSTTKRFDTKGMKIERGSYVSLSNKKLSSNKRYEFTKSGVSPRILPGQPGGIHVNSSYEHDETGWTCEDGRNHELMQQKRFKKLNLISKKLLRPKMYGPKDAELTLVGWGSTKSSVLDAINELKSQSKKVNYMHFIYISPMDEKKVLEMLNSCKDTMILEGNYTAQLRDVIRERTGFYIEKTYLRYDGRPFLYEDIVEKVKEVFRK